MPIPQPSEDSNDDEDVQEVTCDSESESEMERETIPSSASTCSTTSAETNTTCVVTNAVERNRPAIMPRNQCRWEEGRMHPHILEYLDSKRRYRLESDIRDEDELFLLSLVPTLQRLNPQQKSLAKLKLQHVLHEVEFGAIQDTATHLQHPGASQSVQYNFCSSRSNQL